MFALALLAVPQDFPTQSDHLDGWTLQIEKGLPKQHPDEWAKVRKLLDQQLTQIQRTVPDGPLAKLKQIPIWIYWSDPSTPCMAFHPGPEWLTQHKTNPKMAGGVEIGSIKNFLSWTHEQPWMVLHELAHGYHFRFLEKGFDNPDVKAAYDSAMKAMLYDKVLRYTAASEKHYAETNPMEFFAESTESYFGTNDFYPFVNAELKTYDPTTFALMVKIWGRPAHRD